MNFKVHKICRICLKNNNNLTNIFHDNISNNIMVLTSHKIEYNDGLPQSICSTCLQELNAAIVFKEKCNKSYTKLKEYLKSIIEANSESKEINISYIEYYNVLKPNIYNENKSSIISEEIRTEVKLYECKNCFKQFHFDAFQEHICDNTPSGLLNCNICQTKFNSEEDYQSHLIVHEKLDNNKKQTTHAQKIKDTQKVQQCELCGKITHFQSQLKRHMRVHTGERPYVCSFCNKAFRLKAFLVKHLQTHTKIEPTHHCSHCSKSFTSRSSLKEHFKSHSNEKKYVCNICNKKFKALRNLKNHLKIHTGERNYPCKICDKAFVNPFDLRRHVKLHKKYEAIQKGSYNKSKEPLKQLHQCEHCGKFVTNRSDLKKHIRVHTKEKPYTCQTCGKCFSGSSALSVHNRVHTGLKPYTCQHCELSFTQSSNLKVHLRLHTGMKPYVCKICDKDFKRNRDLNIHMKKHEECLDNTAQ